MEDGRGEREREEKLLEKNIEVLRILHDFRRNRFNQHTTARSHAGTTMPKWRYTQLSLWAFVGNFLATRSRPAAPAPAAVGAAPGDTSASTPGGAPVSERELVVNTIAHQFRREIGDVAVFEDPGDLLERLKEPHGPGDVFLVLSPLDADAFVATLSMSEDVVVIGNDSDAMAFAPLFRIRGGKIAVHTSRPASIGLDHRGPMGYSVMFVTELVDNVHACVKTNFEAPHAIDTMLPFVTASARWRRASTRPRHRRGVVPVTASARWRRGSRRSLAIVLTII